MGHMICTRVFPNSYSKKKISKECDQHAIYEGDYHHELVPPIRFIDRVFKTMDEAAEWVQKNDNGWYDSIAVRFKEGRKINWFVKYEFHV